jgi:flagellar M-ring protein FliF
MNGFYQRFQTQVSRIWDNISIRQKILFVVLPIVCIYVTGLIVYASSRPQMVTLVRLDNPAQLARITAKLDADGIKYEMPNDNTILVEKSQKPRTVMNLASENLIGTDPGAECKLFDKTSNFDLPYKRAIQDELENIIIFGSDNIVDARVHITKSVVSGNNKSDSFFASVKLISKEAIPQKQVAGIKHIVAISIPEMSAENVTVINDKNEVISDNSEDDESGE